MGRVLDDEKPEDRSLVFLASSSSNISIRWQQGRFIGAGAFGSVYLAVNLDSGSLMAVKEIKFQELSGLPSLYTQIKDELSVMEMLHHPNVVEYYGIEVHRDKVYIFEEFCQGGSLAALLEHGRIEDEGIIQVYTMQMLEGLAYLHSKGIVHRDIKPDSMCQLCLYVDPINACFQTFFSITLVSSSLSILVLPKSLQRISEQYSVLVAWLMPLLPPMGRRASMAWQ
jgi:mitogen-activated protein kinase kinase kinase